jgi:hypothetical protein
MSLPLLSTVGKIYTPIFSFFRSCDGSQMKGLIFLHSIFSPSIFVKEQKNNFGGKDILQISCTRSKR